MVDLDRRAVGDDDVGGLAGRGVAGIGIGVHELDRDRGDRTPGAEVAGEAGEVAADLVLERGGIGVARLGRHVDRALARDRRRERVQLVVVLLPRGVEYDGAAVVERVVAGIRAAVVLVAVGVGGCLHRHRGAGADVEVAERERAVPHPVGDGPVAAGVDDDVRGRRRGVVLVVRRRLDAAARPDVVDGVPGGDALDGACRGVRFQRPADGVVGRAAGAIAGDGRGALRVECAAADDVVGRRDAAERDLELDGGRFAVVVVDAVDERRGGSNRRVVEVGDRVVDVPDEFGHRLGVRDDNGRLDTGEERVERGNDLVGDRRDVELAGGQVIDEEFVVGLLRVVGGNPVGGGHAVPDAHLVEPSAQLARAELVDRRHGGGEDSVGGCLRIAKPRFPLVLVRQQLAVEVFRRRRVVHGEGQVIPSAWDVLRVGVPVDEVGQRSPGVDYQAGIGVCREIPEVEAPPDDFGLDDEEFGSITDELDDILADIEI